MEWVLQENRVKVFWTGGNSMGSRTLSSIWLKHKIYKRKEGCKSRQIQIMKGLVCYTQEIGFYCIDDRKLFKDLEKKSDMTIQTKKSLKL